jgi:hypothetical protein
MYGRSFLHTLSVRVSWKQLCNKDDALYFHSGGTRFWCQLEQHLSYPRFSSVLAYERRPHLSKSTLCNRSSHMIHRSRAPATDTALLNVTKWNYPMTSHLSNRTVHMDCKDPSSLSLHYQSETFFWINYCLRKCLINVYSCLYNCMNVLRGNLMVLLQFFWERTNYR